MLTEIVSPEDGKPVEARDAVGVGEAPSFAGGKLRADRRIVGVTALVVVLFLVNAALVAAGLMSGALS